MSRIKVVFSVGGMHGGGSERQIVSILRNLDRDRFEPFLYLIYRTGPLLDEVPDDVPITTFEERFGPPRGPGFLMTGKRVNDMRKFLQECEAQVSYDRTFLMTMIAAAAARKAGIPNVSTIVTDMPVGFAQVAGRFQWAKRILLSRLYKSSTHVLANSEGAAKSAEAFYGLSPGTVKVYPNGVDLKHVREQAQCGVVDSWWNRNSTRRRTFRIVTAGRLENQKKGFHLLIDAVDQLRRQISDVDLRLAILGEGPCRESLETQIRATGQSHSIRLVGFQKNAPSWYRSADLFALPSLVEGMPNVLLEAMACGVPVLSADCDSGPREVLGDGEYGALCGANSVESLMKGIRRFLADDFLANRYTDAATQHVDSQYSIESSVGKLEDLFESCVNNE